MSAERALRMEIGSGGLDLTPFARLVYRHPDGEVYFVQINVMLAQRQLPLRLAVAGFTRTRISHGHFNIVLRRTERLSIYHRRVPLHTQRSALSSKPIERPIAPLPMLTRAPYQMSFYFVFADLWLRAIETDCPPAILCIVTAGFALTRTIGKPNCTSK